MTIFQKFYEKNHWSCNRFFPKFKHQYKREKYIILDTIVREAQKFNTIKILPEASKTLLELSLKNCNII